ncbi:MAG: hypothetical protein ACK6BQ_09395 [Bacteroidota bacterium]
MAVPDQTIFAVDENEASINYGTVRQITDEDRLIRLLKLRIEVFFIGQVKPLETVSLINRSQMDDKRRKWG